MKILIIEDEKLLADSLKDILTSRGFEAEAVYDGTSGAAYAQTDVYDLLILDVMMPGMNGYEVARQVRAKRLGVPILMLTAKGEVDDRIAGLDSGADYYLTKPFDIRELLACVGALLRRQGSEVNVVSFGDSQIDLDTATLSHGEKSIRLSAKEFHILRQLFSSGGRNLSKELILTRVWGADSDAVENHVEVYIGFLRKKLAAVGSAIRIVAIRNLGYHLEMDEGEKKGERKK